MKLMNSFSILGLTQANLLNLRKQGNFRSLNLELTSIFNDIDNYGCWCYFGSKWRKGQGKPVDIFDRECHDLVRGYECIYMDTEDENAANPCVPFETQYLEPLQIEFDTPDTVLYDSCTTENNFGNDQDKINCRTRTCLVEAFFIRNLAALKVGGANTNDNYLEENNFDFAGTCTTTQLGPQTKACCGQYPTRFPFRPQGGDYACCQNIMAYNTVMFECCDDGTAKFSC